MKLKGTAERQRGVEEVLYDSAGLSLVELARSFTEPKN